MSAKKTSKKKKKSISPEILIKRQYRKEIQSTFHDAGFIDVPTAADKEFTYNNSTSDFDDVFITENLIVLVEYTTSASSNISGHLKPKKLLYDKILERPGDFINFFDKKFPDFKSTRSDYYDIEQYIVRILYCSKNVVDASLKSQVENVIYYDYPILKYFKSLTETIKLSARCELFEFLGISSNQIGKQALVVSNGFGTYKGSVLPHSFSNFRKGYKVVSFYIDPKSLIDRAYVLRRDGWKDQIGLYQRMISKKKVNEIRKYLNSEKRVFINNIIVTLPDSTKIVDETNTPIEPDRIVKTSPANIMIPDGFATIGLIDGQHRVFAYHEGGLFDEEISKLREKQNLLVTGIIYPKNTTPNEKTKFEANLFLEINSTQSNAKSDLKDEIRLLLDPYQTVSIAKSLINKLNDDGPLAGEFERFFFDSDKIKTTSIVNYGLKPIVKLGGDDSFYSIWSNDQKQNLLDSKKEEVLSDYISYCTKELILYFSAIKNVVDRNLWTADRTVKGRLLNTTIINGFIICLRHVISSQKSIFQMDVNSKRLHWESKFKKLNEGKGFDFSNYKSSQYASMGENMFNKCFS